MSEHGIELEHGHEYKHEYEHKVFLQPMWKWNEKNHHMNMKPRRQARDCIENILFAWVKMNIHLGIRLFCN